MKLLETSSRGALTTRRRDVSSIGSRLNTLRRRAGYGSTRDLATRLQNPRISHRSLEAIEQNKRNPTLVELLEISSALAVSPLALLVDTERPFEVLDILGLGPNTSTMTGDELIDLMSPSLSDRSGALQREQDTLWWIAHWRETYRDAREGVQVVRSPSTVKPRSPHRVMRDRQFAANARTLAEVALDTLEHGGVDVVGGRQKLNQLTTN